MPSRSFSDEGSIHDPVDNFKSHINLKELALVLRRLAYLKSRLISYPHTEITNINVGNTHRNQALTASNERGSSRNWIYLYRRRSGNCDLSGRSSDVAIVSRDNQ